MLLGMLEVLVVLKELVVFVGGMFESVESPNFFRGENFRIPLKKFGAKKDLKILKTK